MLYPEHVIVQHSTGFHGYAAIVKELAFDMVSDFVRENAENPDPVKLIDLTAFVQSKLRPYVKNCLKTLCHF